MNSKRVGQAIKLCREAAGLSQRRMADLLKVSPSYLSLVESGKRRANLETLEAVARELGVPSSLIVLISAEPSELAELSPDLHGRIEARVFELLRASRFS